VDSQFCALCGLSCDLASDAAFCMAVVVEAVEFWVALSTMAVLVDFSSFDGLVLNASFFFIGCHGYDNLQTDRMSGGVGVSPRVKPLYTHIFT
jgi:hypothetical protein